MTKNRLIRTCLLTIASVLVLAACSSKNKTPEPGPLPSYTPLLTVDQVWSVKLGEIDFPIVPRVVGGTRMAVAASDGTVAMLDTNNGAIIWRASAGAPLTAGVGSNGTVTAVVTRNNDLVAFDSEGKEIWRQRVAAQVLTPPLVSGGRVFVNASDRSIQAYDARNGAGLWRQQQSVKDSLTLRRNGVLDAYGNTLLVGLSSGLYGVNPDTGSPEWSLPIGNPRGTNEIDRLADLVGGVARNGNVVCARSYQNAVSCIQIGSYVLWSKPSKGDLGVAVDYQNVYTVDGDGRISAMDQRTGNIVWANTDLLYYELTAPFALGQRSLVIGDSSGNVHLLSRQDGSFIGRFKTDSSGVVATPIAAGDVLILITQNGTIYGFKPN